MLEIIPANEEIVSLLGKEKYKIFDSMCSMIESKYNMDKLWYKAGKAWNYEQKYRRGGKTLCSLFIGENSLGFMVILGKAERDKFEAQKEEFSGKVIEYYDSAKTYHDGKWIMFELNDMSISEDLIKVLLIKRKPNIK